MLNQRQSIWRRAVRRVAKRIIGWRFRHFNPSTHSARNVRVNGVELTVGRGVFDPSLHFTSAFFADYIKKSAGLATDAAVLDIGTGTGVLAIAAALSGCKHVVAVDLNPAALECARINVRKNGLADKVDVQEGEFVPRQTVTLFDHVICNPPYFRGTAKNDAQRAYLAGADLEWFDDFIHHIEPCLVPHGRVLLVLSDAADLAAIMGRFSASGWSYQVVAHRDIFIEIMYVIELVVKKA